MAARLWAHRRLRRQLARVEHEHELEKERVRIARDLHDELGTSLTQIGLLAARMKRQAPAGEMKEGIGQLDLRARRLARELESIVWAVSPKNNTWNRLAAFISQYTRGLCTETGVECRVGGTEEMPALPLAPGVQNHVLAVTKEALNNVLKHSRATSVHVTFSTHEGTAELCIADNGIGFDLDSAEHSERNGLSNMRTRITDIGGTWTIKSTPGQGTEIAIRIPFASSPDTRSPGRRQSVA
jgi:signal transduction histidine kinase